MGPLRSSTVQHDYDLCASDSVSFALYNRLPNSVKSALKEFSFDKLELANGSFITMLGTARVKVYVPRLHKYLYVVFHVLEQTSQPVILGTQFLTLVNVQMLFTTTITKL